LEEIKMKDTIYQNFVPLEEGFEEFEDRMLAREARRRLKEINEDNNVSFDEAKKLAGWKDDPDGAR